MMSDNRIRFSLSSNRPRPKSPKNKANASLEDSKESTTALSDNQISRGVGYTRKRTSTAPPRCKALSPELWLMIAQFSVHNPRPRRNHILLVAAGRTIARLLKPWATKPFLYNVALSEIPRSNLFTILVEDVMYDLSCPYPNPCQCLIGSGELVLRYPRNQLMHLELVVELGGNYLNSPNKAQRRPVKESTDAMLYVVQRLRSLEILDVKIDVEMSSPGDYDEELKGEKLNWEIMQVQMLQVVRTASGIGGPRTYLYRGEGIGIVQDARAWSDDAIVDFIVKDKAGKTVLRVS
ncbi:hypothetical protein B0A48_17282 [Cryoendolithus antarcticus]|uniref:Uncharacterized protein n=1 Tax=Cryoendolithus antarcticus TaxID=1507870 RepID=A0A1V8SBY3_9PEZI|nr:hypothetical protein B0A48_17282 [Cryoendolithus antarcticus]